VKGFVKAKTHKQEAKLQYVDWTLSKKSKEIFLYSSLNVDFKREMKRLLLNIDTGRA